MLSQGGRCQCYDVEGPTIKCFLEFITAKKKIEALPLSRKWDAVSELRSKGLSLGNLEILKTLKTSIKDQRFFSHRQKPETCFSHSVEKSESCKLVFITTHMYYSPKIEVLYDLKYSLTSFLHQCFPA